MQEASKKTLKNMFLKESYSDSWTEYKKSLNSKKMIKWDYVILTASNDEQAKAYRYQIDYRLKCGLLPKDTHYAVLADPDGKRVGSGGATFNVLRYLHNRTQSFRTKRILTIHSGGDSKRTPQYSACGKLFSPVPRTLPDGRRSTLFDEFIITMSSVASRIKDGMLTLSGDVLMLFNPLQINFQSGDALAISIPENVSKGKNHGVFLADENGFVKRFLHKESEDTLFKIGAVDANENVNIDTGAHLMSADILEALYSLIDTEKKFLQFVNDRARISFYADFLYPLSTASTKEEYYCQTPEGEFTNELRICREKIWNTLSNYNMRMISLSPAEFIHFGTTAELLNLVYTNIDNYKFIGWSNNVLSNTTPRNYSISNSIISETAEIGDGSYIEDSRIGENVKIGKRCIISGLDISNCEVDDDTVLHCLKLRDGRFVVRRYNINTNPKEYGFWDKKQYSASNTVEDALTNSGGELLSLSESFNMADTEYILNRQNELTEDVHIENFISKIESKTQMYEALKVLDNLHLDKHLVQKIIKKADNKPSTIKIRVYYYLSNYNKLSQDEHEMLETQCFNLIKLDITKNITYNEALKIQKDEVSIKLPVRVNFGGGWTDTPPYCTECGGTVLNAAITLSDLLPIRSYAKKLTDYIIEFESPDSHDHAIFSSISDIQDNNNPFDPFAIHKAALIACGLIPKEGGSLVEILSRLGGGIYLSTEVINIPRGSGLGTSSILCSAAAKAVMELTGQEYSKNYLYNTVLAMEQIMSTGGGWQDQVGGLSGGIKLISTESGTIQNIKTEYLTVSNDTFDKLNKRFALIYTGQRRLARNILRKIVGGYLAYDKNIVTTLSKSKEIAKQMKTALEASDIDNLAKLFDEHFILSKKLYDGCTNTGIDKILDSIDDLICGRFIAGAGGGGFLQVILKDGITHENLKSRLNEIFPCSEINVWDSEFLRKENNIC